MFSLVMDGQTYCVFLFFFQVLDHAERLREMEATILPAMLRLAELVCNPPPSPPPPPLPLSAFSLPPHYRAV